MILDKIGLNSDFEIGIVNLVQALNFIIPVIKF
jgi:hypothetical protein